MNHQVALLVFGILLLLLGLIGKVKAKEIEVGTSSKLVRALTSALGVVLVVISFGPQIITGTLVSMTKDDPISVNGGSSRDSEESAQEESNKRREALAAEEARREAEGAARKAQAQRRRAKGTQSMPDTATSESRLAS